MNWKKHKRSFQLSALALLLLVIVFSVSAMTLRGSDKQDYVATVNGEKIDRAEFERVLMVGRSRIYDYFKQKYGVDDSPNFWNTSFKGEIPIEKAKSEALKESVSNKIQQIQAKKEGIISDISYTAFVKKWHSENDIRAEKAKKNQPVFGPFEFDEVTFFKVDFSDMVNKVKQKMIKDATLTDADYKTYYEEIKEKYFANTSTIKFESIKIPLINEADGETIHAGTMEKQALENIQAMILAGSSFEDSVKSFKITNQSTVDYEVQTLDSSSLRRYTMLFPTVTDKLGYMKEGDTSQIIEERDAYYLIRTLQKSGVTYKPFEEVKDRVKSLRIEETYDQLIENLVKAAHVEINESAYNEMKIIN